MSRGQVEERKRGRSRSKKERKRRKETKNQQQQKQTSKLASFSRKNKKKLKKNKKTAGEAENSMKKNALLPSNLVARVCTYYFKYVRTYVRTRVPHPTTTNHHDGCWSRP